MLPQLTHLRRFAIGVLMGIASALPGVSGGIMAVCFGVYERLVNDIADIFHKIKSDFFFLLMIGMGVVAGMVATAFGLKYIIEENLAISLFLFMGLIIGQMPSIYGLTEPESGSPRTGHIVAFIGGMIAMAAFMFLGSGESVTLGHDLTTIMILLVAGVVIAMSKIVPGLSGSAILLAIGLYAPLLIAMTSFDLVLISAILVGFCIGALFFAKIVSYLLKKYRRGTYFTILGLTAGSIIVILGKIIADVQSTFDLVGGLIVLIFGIWLSLRLIRFSNEESEKSPPVRTEQL